MMIWAVLVVDLIYLLEWDSFQIFQNGLDSISFKK